MTHLLKLPTGGMRSEILGEIARSVATPTPTAALDWLNDIDDEADAARSGAVARLALSQRNVEAAAQLVDRVPKERANWITAVALGYAQFDVERPPVGAPLRQRRVETAAQFARTVASRNPEPPCSWSMT